MQSKLLLLSFLILFTFTTNYAQSSASVSGIAVQGIARDNNNTALADQTITFTFTLYYINSGPQTIASPTASLTTDAFGIFSYVIVLAPQDYSVFSNNDVWLKIETSDGDIISDELFKKVPYAVSANNGVPTGSIMPYIGVEAPEGWVLCDGRSLTAIDGSANLRALVGNNAPNLQGMFLRGTGTSPVNSQAGPALKATQGDAYKTHTHDDGTLATSSDGNHTHSTGSIPNKGEGYVASYNGNNEVFKWGNTGSVTSSGAGAHSHDVTGNTGSSGTTETRPVNYGVNYIIKL